MKIVPYVNTAIVIIEASVYICTTYYFGVTSHISISIKEDTAKVIWKEIETKESPAVAYFD